MKIENGIEASNIITRHGRKKQHQTYVLHVPSLFSRAQAEVACSVGVSLARDATGPVADNSARLAHDVSVPVQHATVPRARLVAENSAASSPV